MKVTPEFNTMVLFTTNSDSYHGHPDALTCPPGVTRRSIATYYYSAIPTGVTDQVPHSTLFQDRPGVPPRTSNVEKAKQNYRHAGRLVREGTRMLVPDEWVAKVKRTSSKSS